ncbi:MAG: hypothetical protein H8E44_12160 [Planctomycetes bacterium]|nr:hypothetical protein [Planctomycetota bacterium]MBL7043553.1 hypothetical protein [Pirellulaceae bacterium]
MQNQPNTLRFTLRALFICTAFVGLGLAALLRPFAWVLMIVQVVVLLLVVYAFVSALVSTGNRRLFWAAFAATATAAGFLHFLGVPHQYGKWLWWVLHGEDPHPAATGQGAPSSAFRLILQDFYVIAVSTAAAYIIPWLVQRRQESSSDQNRVPPL